MSIQPEPIRIAMWSGPRNISTAMMRSFENRSDTIVVDEPFYACYLAATGLDHPGRDLILKAQSTDWRTVSDTMTAPLPAGVSIFYQKHMCHHMVPEIGMSWTKNIQHAFLIRDPRRLLASYVKSRPDVTLADIGLERQLEIFKRIADSEGEAPPVVDTSDVLTSPAGMLKSLCLRLEISFDPAMLQWPKGKRDSDGVWAPWWYKNVESSTGFDAPSQAPITDVWQNLDDRLKTISEAAMPIYEEMRRFRIEPV